MYDNIPVNERPDYLEHLRKVEECEHFLIAKLRYVKTKHDWTSYEFNSVYEKGNTKIRIVFETTIPSAITLINKDLPYDESKGQTNVEFKSVFNNNSFEIIKKRLLKKEIV